MTVDHLASHNVRVTYYAAHSGHTLNTGQLTHLPLPTSTSEAVEKKLSIGVTAERILQGKSIRLIKNTYHSIHYITLHSYCIHVYTDVTSYFATGGASVTRSTFLTRKDISNRHAKVEQN